MVLLIRFLLFSPGNVDLPPLSFSFSFSILLTLLVCQIACAMDTLSHSLSFFVFSVLPFFPLFAFLAAAEKTEKIDRVEYFCFFSASLLCSTLLAH